MRACQPPPRLWLMTDERQGEALWKALDGLPRGAGIVFRHHRTPPPERRALFVLVRAVARARRLTLVLAATPRLAVAWRADGVHGRRPANHARPLLHTAPVHDLREFHAARRAGAALMFVSPVFATRSHPGERVLGPLRFGTIARGGRHIVALGGMNPPRARRLDALGSYGWAAIDALTPA